MRLSLPESIQDRIIDYGWEQEQIGESGQDVYRLLRDDHVLYLKTATGTHLRADLQAEAERMVWLGDYLPVPQLIEFIDNGERAFLLMTEVKGVMSCDPIFADRIPQVVKALAEGVNLFHAVPIAGCPFIRRRVAQIESARLQMVNGLIDMDDLEDEWSHFTPEGLYQHFLASTPSTPERPVMTHGDYCLPNILIDPDTLQVSGFIDVGRAGVSDGYTDVALAVRSLIRNWGAEYVPLLFEYYGEPLDAERLYFYKLLDEFF